MRLFYVFDFVVLHVSLMLICPTFLLRKHASSWISSKIFNFFSIISLHFIPTLDFYLFYRHLHFSLTNSRQISASQYKSGHSYLFAGHLRFSLTKATHFCFVFHNSLPFFNWSPLSSRFRYIFWAVLVFS